jgi:hypothetical protein
MHRLIVAILAAVDAAIAVAVGIAATLAPLTLLWVFGFGDAADWAALWPASSVIWQFGNLVPLDITIPGDYLAVAGVDQDAASFTLSLAPLAFAGFSAIFAARSGARASQADAWITGILVGSGTFAALATVVALTSANAVAAADLWQAILLPSLVFALPALLAAVVTEWREAGSGVVARLRDRVEIVPHWGAAPGLVARGAAVVVVGLIGLGAVITAVALVLRGGEIIALYESAHLDVLGATVVTLAQLAYLPTMVVWGLAFVAGPGFAVGAGTSVSPAGTQVGVVPGIPILGIIPESTTPWLLLLALGPVALGALAGWIARSRLVAGSAPRSAAPSMATPLSTDAATDPARTSALAGLLSDTAASREPETVPDAIESSALEAEGATDPREDPIGARLVVALGIAVLAAGAAALLAFIASGSIGPGALAEMGPEPGPVALAVGLEVAVGAGILLLAPRAQARPRGATTVADGGSGHVAPADDAPREEPAADEASKASETVPIEPVPTAAPQPRQPFVFPTLPRLPQSPRDPGEGGGSAPVD